MSISELGKSTLISPEDRVLPTLEHDGKRRWIFPHISVGYYFHLRRILGFSLIAFFVTLPWLRINGKPYFLIDVITREVTILGYTFLPTDTLLLAFFMMSVFVSVFLMTALFGRVWCGWGCPQTVYM
jgi:polyferredoxin